LRLLGRESERAVKRHSVDQVNWQPWMIFHIVYFGNINMQIRVTLRSLAFYFLSLAGPSYKLSQSILA